MIYGLIGRIVVAGAVVVGAGYGVTFLYIWIRLYLFYHG